MIDDPEIALHQADFVSAIAADRWDRSRTCAGARRVV